MAVAEAPVLRPVFGRDKPRIAPPTPARSQVKAFRETAEGMGITLMPWQETAARYLTATDKDGLPLYREVCIVVARQNGKTHLMKPFIVAALRAGLRVMHIAQTRELPRIMFGVIADSIDESLLPKRRGKGGKMQTIWPRYGAGQEEIVLNNGGSYRIAAANRGGARGHTNDIVIIDELREMVTDEIIGAVESTTMTSEHPQLIYLSNAGTDESVVLNEVRDRAGKDPSLAYLEWSASPERSAADVGGWLEANPAVGHIPTAMKSLESFYRRHQLAGTLANFETENLCRWVKSMREPLIAPAVWALCEAEALTGAKRPVMGISMDPSGTRFSAVLSWQQPDGSVAVRSLVEASGEPIDIPILAADLRAEASRRRVARVAFDPMTDAELAKYFTKPEPVTASKYANATAQFVNLVEARKLRWMDAAAITDDLTWTARKAHEETGSFQAVRANDDRPVTAVLAAIRAVWMASGPRPPIARIY